MKDPSQPAQGRLIHFTPLRYPGGKAKLAAYVKRLMKDTGCSMASMSSRMPVVRR